MRRKWQKAREKEVIKFVMNEQIKVPQVFLINEEGGQSGVLDTAVAIAQAKEMDLDLVLVNPKVDPPVAKIVDLGQLKYEMEKKAHRQKVAQKKTDTKEIRLSVRIGEHDFNFRLKKAQEFLAADDKVKVEIILKGRERQHPMKAEEVIRDFENKLKATPELNVAEETSLTKMGGRFSIILFNKKA